MRAQPPWLFLYGVNSSLPLIIILKVWLFERSFQGVLREEEADRNPQGQHGPRKLGLLSSAPHFMPISSYSCSTPSLTPRFQVWEIEPNGTWKLKWDPATHSESSLSSSQNLAQPQSFTWFWVKTTLNHLFFIHGFSLKMRFHAKSAPVSEVFPWQSLGTAWANVDSASWHLRSVSIEECASGSSSEGPGLERLRFWSDLHEWETSRTETRSTMN